MLSFKKEPRCQFAFRWQAFKGQVASRKGQGEKSQVKMRRRHWPMSPASQVASVPVSSRQISDGRMFQNLKSADCELSSSTQEKKDQQAKPRPTCFVGHRFGTQTGASVLSSLSTQTAFLGLRCGLGDRCTFSNIFKEKGGDATLGKAASSCALKEVCDLLL